MLTVAAETVLARSAAGRGAFAFLLHSPPPASLTFASCRLPAACAALRPASSSAPGDDVGHHAAARALSRRDHGRGKNRRERREAALPASDPDPSAPAPSTDADSVRAALLADASDGGEDAAPPAGVHAAVLRGRDAAEAARPEFPPTNFHEFAPRILVMGVGGAGGNACNNMVASGLLPGVDFCALNTDAQHLGASLAPRRIQIGRDATAGLGCGADPDAGRVAAEESAEEIADAVSGSHMVFITAGMGGGTGTGAAPVVAKACAAAGILTVGVVTRPFRFEGTHRMRLADRGVAQMAQYVDSMIVVPNQNLFGVVDEGTSMMDSFALADEVLLGGVRSITDLMVSPGLINLDFADVQAVMRNSGTAVLGTGEASGEDRAIRAATAALTNPLLDGDGEDAGRVRRASGMLVNITGGADMTLFEVDRAATVITHEVEDRDANIIFGSAYDDTLDGSIRVSVVATGIDGSTEERIYASADIPPENPPEPAPASQEKDIPVEGQLADDKDSMDPANMDGPVEQIQEEGPGDPPKKDGSWWDRVRRMV